MASKKTHSDLSGICCNTNPTIGFVAGAINPTTDNEQYIKNIIDRYCTSYNIDDDEIDAGDYDVSTLVTLILTSTCDDPTKVNELENALIPTICMEGQVALDTLKLGNSAGGVGVSWGNTAAQTQIDITANDHNITHGFTVAALDVYSAANPINWIRAADLCAGAIVLATEVGDATHVTIAVLPAGVMNEDGEINESPRVFIGLPECVAFTDDAIALFLDALNFCVNVKRNMDAFTLADTIAGLPHVGIQDVYPELANSVQITGHANAYTYGNYSTIAAAAAITNTFRVTGIMVEALSDVTDTYILEVSRLSDNSILCVKKFKTTVACLNFNLAVISANIVGGEGIQARVATRNGGGKTIDVSIEYSEII